MKKGDMILIMILVCITVYLLLVNLPNKDKEVLYIDEFTTIYENE